MERETKKTLKNLGLNLDDFAIKQYKREQRLKKIKLNYLRGFRSWFRLYDEDAKQFFEYTELLNVTIEYKEKDNKLYVRYGDVFNN